MGKEGPGPERVATDHHPGGRAFRKNSLIASQLFVADSLTTGAPDAYAAESAQLAELERLQLEAAALQRRIDRQDAPERVASHFSSELMSSALSMCSVVPPKEELTC